MTDLTMLHKKWLHPFNQLKRIECDHPIFWGSEAALKAHRENCAEKVASVATIALPISVQTHIVQRSNLGWFEQAARALYIYLKANEDNYGLIIIQDENSFKLM